MTGLKANDKIFVVRFTGHDHSYQKATVVKVTPKGFADVMIGSLVVRFNPEGKEHGGDTYRSWRIDDKPLAEREEILARESRTKNAANAIREIRDSFDTNVNFHYGKQGLKLTIDELQKKLDAARELVNNI